MISQSWLDEETEATESAIAFLERPSVVLSNERRAVARQELQDDRERLSRERWVAPEGPNVERADLIDQLVVGTFTHGTIHAEMEPRVAHFMGATGTSDETVKLISLPARGGARVLFVVAVSTCRAPGVGQTNTNKRSPFGDSECWALVGYAGELWYSG